MPPLALRVVIRAASLVRVFCHIFYHQSVSKWKTKSTVAAAFCWKYWGLCLSAVPRWLQEHALPGHWRVETPSNLSIPLTTLSTTRLDWKLPEWRDISKVLLLSPTQIVLLSDQPPEQISRVIGARKSRSSVPFLTNHIIVVTLREDVVSLTSLHVKDLSYADVPIVYLFNC